MNCPTYIDHEVALVAYTEISAGSESRTQCYNEQSTKCRSATQAEILAVSCEANLLERFNRKNGSLDSCCEIIYSEKCSTIPGRPLVAHWTIQNQWGADWGENGSMRIEVVSGIGVSGINQVATWVEMQALLL